MFKFFSQVKQNPTLPIQKQTTAAQTGKILLPSNNKANTAKVAPTSSSVSNKGNSATVSNKIKGRPKGMVVKPGTPTGSAGKVFFYL